MSAWPKSGEPTRYTFALIARHYRDCHKNALGIVGELSEEEFGWRPSSGPQTIGWNLWHVARWDDYLAEVLLVQTPALSHLGPAKQIWKSREIAKQWGLDSVELGLEEAGTSLTDHEAAGLTLPPKLGVAGYAAEAFGHLDAALPLLDDSLLEEVLPTVGPDGLPADDNYGDTIVAFMNHAYEHFGTMQALKGMLGRPGK